ncbi:hypothetical protein JCM3770_003087 [Rhodotorula araucariae]
MRAAVLIGALACALGAQAQTSSSGIVLAETSTIFAFGDSYSWNGYSPFLGVNNFPGYGATSSGGYNWLQFLTTLGSRPINLYDLAASGATTNNSVVSSAAVDLVNQVGLWNDWFAPGTGEAITTAQAAWETNSTLFTVWIGINDVGNGYLQGQDFTASLPAVFESYTRAIASLYTGGARNFLILGVPPTWRTPLVQSYGPQAVATYGNYVSQYNTELARLVGEFRTAYPDARFALFDTVPFFNQILDNPANYGIADATTACTAYATLYNQPAIALPACTWPMSAYFWWNNYHPTWTVHKLLASVLAQTLVPAASSSALPSTSTSTLASTSSSSLPIPTTPLTNTVPVASASGSTVAPSATGGVDGGSSSAASRSYGRARQWAATAAAVVVGGSLGGALLL